MTVQSRLIFDTSNERFAPGHHRDACNLCGVQPDQIIIVCLPSDDYLGLCLKLCKQCIDQIKQGEPQ